MKKVKALIVPLIILGLLTIIVLNIKRESNVEGLTLVNNNVEAGKVYVEVILWTDGRETEFIKTDWLNFVIKYKSLPQTIIIRKDCKDMLDFLNSIPAMKAVIEASNATTPGSIEKDLIALCPCVMLLFHDKSNNVIKRQVRGIIPNSALSNNILAIQFETLYNTPYEGKTVSTI
jgi:hypothetical protein